MSGCEWVSERVWGEDAGEVRAGEVWAGLVWEQGRCGDEMRGGAECVRDEWIRCKWVLDQLVGAQWHG